MTPLSTVLPSFILLPVRRRTTLEATLVIMPSTSAINHGNDTEDSDFAGRASPPAAKAIPPVATDVGGGSLFVVGDEGVSIVGRGE